MQQFRNKLIYLLKHNAFAQGLYRFCGTVLLRFVGLFVKTNPDLVVFISMMGTRYNDSPRAIHEYMLNHDDYKHYKMIWAFERPQDFPGIPSVKIDTPKFFLTALKAGYWISNTQFERGLSYKKKRTKYLYTMHGTAIKLCGNDCPGRKDFDYRRVNYLCVESEYDKNVFKRAFRAKEESFIETGRPCNDILWHVTEDQKKEMRDKLGIPSDKKVILYAPTWRDSTNGGNSYDIKPPIDLEIWEKRLSKDYVVLFRAHHITTKIMDVRFNDFLKNYSDYPEINDLYIASDLLITDYSSVMVDYAILERPILCFAYDFNDYLKERGTYFDLETELPNKPCRTQDELLDMIETIDFEDQRKRTAVFKSKYDQYGGDGVRAAVEVMFG